MDETEKLLDDLKEQRVKEAQAAEKRLQMEIDEMNKKYHSELDVLEKYIRTLQEELKETSEKLKNIGPVSAPAGGDVAESSGGVMGGFSLNERLQRQFEEEIFQLKKEKESFEASFKLELDKNADLSKRNDILTRKVEDLRGDVRKLETNKDDLRKQVMALEINLERATEEKFDALKKIDEMEIKVKQAEVAMEETKRMKLEVEDMKRQVKETLEKKQEAETHMYSLEAKVSDLTNDIKLQVMTNERLELNIKNMRREMEDMKDKQRQKPTQSVTAGDASSVASLDGDKDLDSVKKKAKDIILKLKENITSLMQENALLQCSKQELDEARESRKNYDEMKIQLEAYKKETGVNNLIDQRDEWREKAKTTIGYLEKEREAKKVLEVQLEKIKEEYSQTKSLKNKLEMLLEASKKSLSEETRVREDLQKQYKEAQRQLKDVKDQLNNMSDRGSAKETKVAQKLASKLEKDLAEAQKRIQAEKDDREAKLAEFAKLLQAAREREKALETAKQDISEDKSRLELENQRLKLKLNETSGTSGVQLQVISRNVDKLTRQLEEEKKSKEALEDTLTRTEREVKSLKEKLDLELIEREGFEKSKSLMEEKLKAFKVELETAETEKEKVEREKRKVDREFGRLKQKLELAEQQVEDLSKKTKDMEKKYKSTINDLKGDLEVHRKGSRT
eukprot:TRINITY_DN2415_c0_g1_i1.p1 TRINITY_DN2415_c0_g1~~TRINITY_DN2415_c0_g1_i1.p1  ORF type:complete len:690 (+),score=243.35 TRINITY_DN2415_c0_g1_i1:35-2071(+)